MTQAMKVYQIADQLGMDYETVVAKIRAFGIPVNNKMSKIDGDVAEQIKSSLLKDKQQDWIEIELENGVRKRVRKPTAAPAPTTAKPVEPSAVAPARREEPAPVAPRPVVEAAPVEKPAEPTPAAPPPVVEAHAAEPARAPAPEVVPVEKPVVPPATATAAPATAPAPAETKPAVKEPAPAPEVHEPAPSPAARAAEPAPVETKPAPVETKPVVAPVPAASEEKPAPAEKPAVVAAEKPAPVEKPASAPAPAVAATPAPTAAPAPVVAEKPAERPAPAPAVAATASASEARAEMRAVSPAPSIAPPAAPATPSTPPPRTGTVQWDPVTKQLTHIQPSRPSRPQMVDPSRIQPQGRPGMRPGPGGVRPTGPGGRPLPGRRPMGRIGGGGPKGPPPTPTTMAQHKRVVKIEGQVALQELARRMAVKSSDVLMKLLGMGMTGVNINTTLDSDTAKLIAQEFGYEVSDVAVADDAALKAILPEFKDKDEDLVSRPPVVTVMGHVDHGKTTLLDAILGMRVAEGEAGGITQKVSAYRVETPKGPVVFFDTPGHEAFTKLRARGAETTDVAVLVVAADDGVMPTTVEAINHVKAANVPIVVAMNKMDKPDAKPERVIQQLMAHEVVPEEFGGETLVVKVSAKQRTGIDELLENLALQSEVLDLKANPKRPGRGTVFDATLDKGRGVVARILVQDGTVRSGDVVLSGTSYGKIRAMFDDRGKPITKAGPSTPIEILGLNEVPSAGDEIYVVQDTKKAQAFAEERKIKTAQPKPMNEGLKSLEDIQEYIARGETITIGIIIKAEAQASVEALSKALTELSTEKVRIQIIHSGIGGINENDVNLAITSRSVIIGFNVRPQGKTAALAESEKVQIRLYNIIYEAVDDIKALMVGQLKPTLVEKALGKADVRQVFNITKVGQIAGCYVTDGKILRTARARLVRDSVQVWEGKLASLKRFKEDAKEVAAGYECGIGLENFNDIKPGDVIEAFEMEEVAAKL